MAIGERIRFFRIKCGMKQKDLSLAVGLRDEPGNRIAQYESKSRIPRPELTKKLADALNVSPLALTVPDIDSMEGLMHTFFTLEDLYGIEISESDGDIFLRVDPSKSDQADILYDKLQDWLEIANKLQTGQIFREEYDQWRYNYPTP